MPTQDTGFDAFFQAITTSPEFKSAVTKDWKWDSMDALEASLRQMESWVAKAADVMKSFDESFGNPPPEKGELEGVTKKGIPNSVTHPNLPFSRKGWSQTPPKTGNAKDEEQAPAVEVQHFEKKEGKPWGFEAVAGMDQLKAELKDSFIKPLKFKFMVERIRKERESENSPLIKGDVTEWQGNLISSSPKLGEDGRGVFSTPPLPPPNLGGESDKNPPTPFIKGEPEKNTILLERLYTEYEKFKISIPTGMLLYWPPGTGKTFITKKLAEELGCGFISKNMGEFGSSYLHQTTKNIKDFFTGAKQAAENEPIILFLDEIDSLVSARTDRVDANKAEEISQFLQEFNGLETAPNLIVIAATNRPDHLDPAILRSGRLDKKIYIGPPDELARRELFKMYIEKAGRPHGKLDYDELARLTEWYVSSDIEAMCDEVARDASRDLLELVDEAESGTLTEKHLDGHKITMDTLRTTITETPSSLKMVDMSVYESWLEKIK
jgi:DNA polymerase III delta prime subunit